MLKVSLSLGLTSTIFLASVAIAPPGFAGSTATAYGGMASPTMVTVVDSRCYRGSARTGRFGRYGLADGCRVRVGPPPGRYRGIKPNWGVSTDCRYRCRFIGPIKACDKVCGR